MLQEDVKKFIEENIELILEKKFDLLYERAIGTRSNLYDVGRLTDALYDAGINPLEELTEIPPLYFNESKITEFTVPKHIKACRKASLAFSNLKTVIFHDDCEILESCCHNSKIESFKMPYIMNEVPDECFYNCQQLYDVDIGDVEQIGSEAFAYCTNLRTLFIGRHIEFISPSAFNGCERLTIQCHADNDYVINFAQEHEIRLQVI